MNRKKPDKGRDVVSSAKTLGAAVGAEGGNAEAAIADELEAYVQQRVAEALAEYQAQARAQVAAPGLLPSYAEAVASQQEAIDMMFTQASAYRGVSNMATVLDSGETINGKSDSGAIRIIAMALGLEDPSTSRTATKARDERMGIAHQDSTF